MISTNKYTHLLKKVFLHYPLNVHTSWSLGRSGGAIEPIGKLFIRLVRDIYLLKI